MHQVGSHSRCIITGNSWHVCVSSQASGVTCRETDEPRCLPGCRRNVGLSRYFHSCLTGLVALRCKTQKTFGNTRTAFQETPNNSFISEKTKELPILKNIFGCVVGIVQLRAEKRLAAVGSDATVSADIGQTYRRAQQNS